MRLVFFDFTINYGGGPQGTVYLAERLNADNEVHIIDAYGACDLYCEAIKKADIPLHILNPNPKRTYIGSKGKLLARVKALLQQIPELWRLRRRLVKKVLEISPDMIWVSNEKSLVLLVSSSRLREYPLVMYMRGWCTPDQVGNCLRWLLKHKVAAIIAHSRATISQLKRLGIPDKKLHFTRNTIDMEKTEQDAQKTLEKALLGTDKWPRMLLPAARPVHEKGHLTAVKAMARLKSAGYNPALWLPGKIPTGVDNSFIDQLQRLIEQLGVKDNIFFLGWCENMPALIKSCDIVILPTHTEGFPRVILEAMLLKRPVCATPVGGIPEVVKHGETGLLFDVDDDQVLAEQIKKIITEQSIRERFVQQAYDFVRKKFRSCDHTRAVMEAFRSVADHHEK
ncbi:MAG: glycosyltransferase family 4 protein [Planctomycetota bacterium]|jgi:glycosyltransferase involved in cell wall biosynthesis